MVVVVGGVGDVRGRGPCVAGGHAWRRGVCGRYHKIWSMSGSLHPTGMHSCYRLQAKFGAR